ncbi:MAG TPA: asparagine synthase (glutamine-hydrolyzing) [Thermoanaerobaculia bacterium]|jgi:asparagine synthase (glutamine-hydrolysing)
MCGIVGMFSPRGRVSRETLSNATERLYHRGPDGRRLWIADHGRVGLGHARLSIIDLTTGDQPIASEDGSLHIVVNGEFYDYERIQKELEGLGHRLRTRSDSEIALHLYEDFGTACLSRLRGEFAMLLWDEANQVFFAARDRFGIKPLFYAGHGGTLYFASEVKALFAAGVPARWNREAISRGASGAGHPAQSLYEGVSQLLPGHYLLATAGGTYVHRYWDFDYARAGDGAKPAPDPEYAERLRSALDEAVRLRLRADVPVGCYLSGGLDSCSVIGLASRHLSTPIRAFTLTFDRPDYDESAIAKEMAERCGAEYYPVPIRQDDLADHFSDATWHAETLCFNAHGVAKFVLSRAVREAGYKVVLTGEGSDEIFGGYPHFRRDMLLYDNGGQDPQTVKDLLGQLERANPVSRGLLLPDGQTVSTDGVKRALGFTPSWIEATSGALFKLRDMQAAAFAAEYSVRDPYRALLNSLDVPGRLAGRAPVHQSLYLWSKTILASYILVVLGDRMEMAHSVEGRVPFLDHHVVELVVSLPVAAKIRGMTEKFMLREAARPVLTDTVYKRQKHPFLSPPATLEEKGKLNQLMQDTLRGPVLKSMGFFDPAKVAGLLDALPKMDAGARTVVDQGLMLILSACVLHERFGLAA